MLRVIHVITDLDTGGAETMLLKVAAGLKEKGVQQWIVSLRQDGTIKKHLENCGIEVVSLDLSHLLYIVRDISVFVSMLRRCRPHVVQGWMYHGNFMSLVAKLVCPRAKIVWNVRQAMGNFAKEKWSTRIIVRVCGLLSLIPAAVIYNSCVSSTQHEKKAHYANKRSMVIPNGFDTSVYCPSKTIGSDARELLGIPKSAFVFGHVARFHAVKGQSIFLRAARDFAREVDRVFFVMVGTNITPDNSELQPLSEALVTSRKLFMLGERHDMPNIYRMFDAFCLSSMNEGFPNTVGEAMSCEVPCIVTDVGDCRSIVGDSGYIVKPGDERGLGRILRLLYMMPVADREELGKRARARVLESYSLESVIFRYRQLYTAMRENVPLENLREWNMRERS